MTELEKIERAKLYIDKLAQGINPLDDTRLSETDIANNVRISRCFFFVSDILRKVIENGIDEPKKNKYIRNAFYLSDEAKSLLVAQSTPLSVKYITDKINSLIDEEASSKLKATTIASFLVEIGMLEITERPDGKNTKIPTENGKAIGLFLEERQGQHGSYSIVCYNESAQQFVYDNIDAIIEYNNQRKPKREKKPRKNEPEDIVWSPGLDAFVLDLVSNNVPVYEIAERLHCSKDAIERRISKLLLRNN